MNASLNSGRSQSSETVVVVGGGLAGIAAALKLARQGVRVTLIESKRRLGGRAGSFVSTDPHGVENTVDYCQHVGMACCHSLRQLIRWLGQEQAWQEHRQLHFYGPTGNYRCLKSLPYLPAPLHISHWLWRWPGLNASDRYRIGVALMRMRRIKPNEETDQVSAQAWLASQGQSERAIERFWSTIIVSALGEATNRVSLASVCKVFQDGFMNDRSAFHLLVPTQPLDQLFNQNAAEVLRKSGVNVRLSSPVASVSEAPDGLWIQLNSERIKAQSVVLAIAWHQMRRLDLRFQSGSLDTILKNAGRLESSPITGVHTWWDRAWLDTEHATIVGRDCQWVFPKPALQSEGPTDHHYYQIVISASHALETKDPESLSTMLHRDLAHVFPKVGQARLERVQPVTDPQAVFSVTPGAMKLRPNTSTPIPNLWLAGDWTQTGWPSTMEGAVKSGFEAAEAILESNSPQTTQSPHSSQNTD